jgi:hypothetical protein
MGHFYVQASQVVRAPPPPLHPPSPMKSLIMVNNARICMSGYVEIRILLVRDIYTSGCMLKRLAQENRAGIKQFFDHFQ